MSNWFTEDFGSTDYTSIGSLTGWTERCRSTATLGVVSGQAESTYLTGANLVLGHISSSYISSANYKVTSDINANGQTSGNFQGVCARRVDYSTDDSNFYTALSRPNSNQVVLYRRVNGSWTGMGSPYSTTISNTGTYTIALTVDGQNLSVEWEGTPDVITTTNTVLAPAGDAGINTGDGSNTGYFQWDNFSVDDLSTGVIVTPAASAGVAGISAPTTVLGSLSITPTPISAVANKAEPTAINGSISITPTPISAIGAIVNPTVAITDSFITPSAAVAVAGIANPTVILGSLAITPTPVSAIGVSLDPSVIYGAIVPSSADAVAGVSNPTVVLGSLAITPAAATAVASRYNPTVNDGSISTKELVVGARRRKR